MTTEANQVLDDPRLRPFLPLLYAAWADGELTDEEIATLRTRIAGVVDRDRSEALDRWLDSDNPPSANELEALAARIRSRSLPEWQTLGPIELGLRLAGSVPDSVLETLRRLDLDLGPFGPTAVTALVDRSSPAILDPLPEKRPAPFDPRDLRRLVDGPHSEVKTRLRRILSRPDFSLRYGLSVAEHRQQVTTWLAILTEEGVGALGFPPEVGGTGDPGGFVAAFSTLGHHDLSLLTKFGVQFGLFAGTVMRLGTRRHHPVVAGAIRLDPPGCFAMTEIGHGSNVAELQTTATFLPEVDQWEINTPSPQAQKDYIGNAAVDGRLAVVFARLLVGELDHGVHAFLVPIRSDTGRTLPGVTIADDGPKAGLNGVDNGSLSFDRVRVPSGALLDRFASVSEDGTYHSPIASPVRRFFTTLGTLVGGRVSVASAAVATAESALTIAVRYAWRRRQFSTDGGPENRLIDYRTHQRRLLTRLAA
ncbi:MAG: acyl-CoA dehydrogenase family protein, partial [Acidimicrobiia bacterium]